ncbi:MAG: hypothetical protein AAGJ56_03440 [Myxococcota bacterium]
MRISPDHRRPELEPPPDASPADAQIEETPTSQPDLGSEPTARDATPNMGIDPRERLGRTITPRAALGALGPRDDTGLNENLQQNLVGGLRYGAFLEQRGFPGPANHVVEVMHRLMPEVPLPEGTPTELAAFASTIEVTRANRGGVLNDVIGSRRGDPAAERRLRNRMLGGELEVAATADEPGDPPERWRLVCSLWTHNDNLATLTGGGLRSDDGATAAFGFQAGWLRGDAVDSERWDVSLGHNLFTERGGMSRSDIVEFTLEHLRTRPSDRLFFDTVTTGWLAGFQGIGDFKGDVIQDGFHALMEGTPLAGRRLGAGLQDDYTSPPQLAALFGAQVRGSRQIGLFEYALGAEVRVPVGAHGVGRVGPEASARIGRDTGVYGTAQMDVAYQWTLGDALRFDGAPRPGFVLSPRVGVGWQFDRWNIGLEWQGNRWGTQDFFGNRQGESVALTLCFGGRPRN